MKPEPGRLAQSGASLTANQGVLFQAPVRPYSFVEIGHEKISTTILTLPLIQEGQVLANELALRTGKQCGYIN